MLNIIPVALATVHFPKCPIPEGSNLETYTVSFAACLEPEAVPTVELWTHEQSTGFHHVRGLSFIFTTGKDPRGQSD